MQLILVVGKMDMINEIYQMLSFCWKLSSAYLSIYLTFFNLPRPTATATAATAATATTTATA